MLSYNYENYNLNIRCNNNHVIFLFSDINTNDSNEHEKYLINFLKQETYIFDVIIENNKLKLIYNMVYYYSILFEWTHLRKLYIKVPLNEKSNGINFDVLLDQILKSDNKIKAHEKTFVGSSFNANPDTKKIIANNLLNNISVPRLPDSINNKELALIDDLYSSDSAENNDFNLISGLNFQEDLFDDIYDVPDFLINNNAKVLTLSDTSYTVEEFDEYEGTYIREISNFVNPIEEIKTRKKLPICKKCVNIRRKSCGICNRKPHIKCRNCKEDYIDENCRFCLKKAKQRPQALPDCLKCGYQANKKKYADYRCEICTRSPRKICRYCKNDTIFSKCTLCNYPPDVDCETCRGKTLVAYNCEYCGHVKDRRKYK